MTPAVAVLLLGIYFAASAGVACLFCRWARKRIAAQQHGDEAEPQPVPAAPDNQPGVNRGDWDDCELILAATTEVEAGLDRLFKHLGQPREEQQ